MILKKLLSTALVTAIALSSATAVFADDESIELIPFEANSDYTVKTSEAVGPAISFDKKEWSNYVKLTPDAEKAGLSLKMDTTTAYQGGSLRISADNTAKITDLQAYASFIRDANGNLVYPEAENNEEYITMGIELDAADVGLSTFDGCTIVFTYRFDETNSTALMGSSAFAYPATEEYETIPSTPTHLERNDLLDNNVTQYRETVVMCPADKNGTKFIIEVPVENVVTGAVFYVDNISITLPKADGEESMCIKNLDGYNENATPKETVDTIEVSKNTGTASTDSQAEEKSSSSGVVVIIIIAVVGLAVAGGVVFLIIKKKNKFY